MPTPFLLSAAASISLKKSLKKLLNPHIKQSRIIHVSSIFLEVAGKEIRELVDNSVRIRLARLQHDGRKCRLIDTVGEGLHKL